MKEYQSYPPSAFLKKFVLGYSFEKEKCYPGCTSPVIFFADTLLIKVALPPEDIDHFLQPGVKEDGMIIVNFKHNAPKYFTFLKPGEIHLNSGRARSLLAYLSNCFDYSQLSVLINLLLITILTEADPSFPYHAITAVANQVIGYANPLNIERLASQSNMSLRNFERRFHVLIGVAPKLFCRMARFNRAVDIKKKNPKEKWASIAYECGFCNQTHLTREFKSFAGAGPNAFVKKNRCAGLLFENINSTGLMRVAG